MRIGILGLGFMGATHLNAFAQLEGVEVAAVCARDPRALAGDLRHVGGNLNRDAGVHDFSRLHTYTDWRELVADPELDAVDICLPTDAHASVSLAALAAGKHVLCEKPMALTKAECEEITAAAKKRERVLMIGQVLRFWPEYRYLQGFVNEQRPSIVSATFSRRCEAPNWSGWLMDTTRSGGAVIDLLVHDIDQVLWLFGLPQQVSAHSLGEVDTVSARLQYSTGLQVHIEGGWFTAGVPFSMGYNVRTRERELEFSAEGLRMNGEAVAVTGADAYETELAYFVACCRANKQPELCPPEDSARAVELALLLKQSRTLNGEELPCEI